jgi:hypothetical protein
VEQSLHQSSKKGCEVLIKNVTAVIVATGVENELGVGRTDSFSD